MFMIASSSSGGLVADATPALWAFQSSSNLIYCSPEEAPAVAAAASAACPAATLQTETAAAAASREVKEEAAEAAAAASGTVSDSLWFRVLLNPPLVSRVRARYNIYTE